MAKQKTGTARQNGRGGVSPASDEALLARRSGDGTLDAVGIYLEQLQQLPGARRLSREEEAELWKVSLKGVRASEEADKRLTVEWKRFVKSKRYKRYQEAWRRGWEADLKLIESQLPFVVSIAKSLYEKNPHHAEFGDLICAGNCGLLLAIRRFDPALGYRLSTYASWWIRNMISWEIRQAAWPFRIPDSCYKDVLRLRKTIGRLTQERRREPTRKEQAEATGWPTEKVDAVSPWLVPDVISIYKPIGEDGQSTLADFIADEQGNFGYLDAPADGNSQPADAAADLELKEVVEEALSTLPPREKKVLSLRFGLDDGRCWTLEEVGREFNVTRECIRLIEVKAIRKLRHPSRSKKLKQYLE